MRSRNEYWCGKARIITYSEYVFIALIIHHAKRMPHILFSSLACPALPYFFHIIS